MFDLARRLSGQQATDASGLFYNYQREYDPAVGRYSQSDPIGLDAGISTYSYVESNPNSNLDMLGLDSGQFQFEKYRMKQPEALPATDIGDALVAGRILSNYNS
ncbi:RHS repeat-associated core domain-containing protein [Stenotrophomonas sp. DR822]|uniref:RHS repeat-associated core domain-containing protein n=1 Tax=Stenotrophomonas sp. DR822 TaxID=2871174 RepID=UPI0021BBE221|nr:RHS repeat-associated core domain-containing protein [Stenotrophomonas sp. DR822]